MTLQDLFDDLSFGELVHFSIGGSGEQGIPVEKQRQMTAYFNRALTVIHNRFKLKEGRLKVPLVEGETEYPLVSETLPVIKVLHVPWPEGFSSDVIKPPGLKPTLSINDDSADYGVYTPKHNILSVPAKVWEAGVRELSVVYQGDHPKLDKTELVFDPSTIEVDLPEILREALLVYVAMLVTTPKGTNPEGYHEGQHYLTRFREICQEVEMYGFDLSAKPELLRFEGGGWV